MVKFFYQQKSFLGCFEKYKQQDLIWRQKRGKIHAQNLLNPIIKKCFEKDIKWQKNDQIITIFRYKVTTLGELLILLLENDIDLREEFLQIQNSQFFKHNRTTQLRRYLIGETIVPYKNWQLLNRNEKMIEAVKIKTPEKLSLKNTEAANIYAETRLHPVIQKIWRIFFGEKKEKAHGIKKNMT